MTMLSDDIVTPRERAGMRESTGDDATTRQESADPGAARYA